MTELVKMLCELPGASGCEDEVRNFIRKAIEPFADEIREDAIGNLMVFRKGEKALERPVVVCAHMDEAGLIVKNITDEGMLKFGFTGNVDIRTAIGKPVRFGGTCGIIGIKAVHLTTAEERKTMPKAKELYIDIGAQSKKEAGKKISLGDYGVFDSKAVEFGGGMIKAKALDGRTGCAALIKLLGETPAIDTWFCFTVQEEAGLRGAATMAYALDPGFALVLGGTAAFDLPEVKNGEAVCRAGKGIVIPFMDDSAIYDKELFGLLRMSCDNRGLPWQTNTRVLDKTDAGSILKTREGVRTCALSVPVRYMRSPSCVASVSDIELLPEAARAFLEELGGESE